MQNYRELLGASANSLTYSIANEPKSWLSDHIKVIFLWKIGFAILQLCCNKTPYSILVCQLIPGNNLCCMFAIIR